MAIQTATIRKRIFGTGEKPVPVDAYKVGALRFELSGGQVGAIHYQGVEVLRGISFLLRDADWGTCAAKLTRLKVSKDKKNYSIKYVATVTNGAATLRYVAEISATDTSLVFSVHALPDKNFKTNRTGFVVLHPIDGVAGKPLVVTHVDGTVLRTKFPLLISPGQPVFDIRALEHTPAPGLKAKVVMEGQKFEMEDQRNWGDASFKTYVGSLLDPWPYVLPGGKAFSQSVQVNMHGTLHKSVTRGAVTDLAQRRARVPEIGLAVTPADAAQSVTHRKALKKLHPRVLTCFVDVQTPDDVLQRYGRLAHAGGCALALEVVLPGLASAPREMADVARRVKLAGLSPETIIVTQAKDLKSFQPNTPRPGEFSFDAMATAARRYFPDAQIGGGMLSNFTEFNRKRPPRNVFDFITHSTCPIVHDVSDRAVMQTLEALPHMFRSAKAIIGDAPYHLGPSTLAARMNPYGNDVADNPGRQRICLAPNDPRQFGSFAVAWNLGLIAAAAKAGLERVSLGGLTGPRGVLDKLGKPTPLFGFLEALMPYAGRTVTWLEGKGVAGVQLDDATWLSNLTPDINTVTLNSVRLKLQPYETRVLKQS